MPEDLPKALADFDSKGYVIAPAGYGKTHLIALAVNASSHRQLILTHTFAGVNSIKSKMVNLGVPSSKYQVDTIASWTLRLCLAYPKASGWATENPTSVQWNKLYEACRALFSKEFIRQVIHSTFTGFYVDEYQDCSDVQHSLVCALAELLPCRILGDPLQAIFDFADKPVDWDKCIYPHFKSLGELEIPWRWHNANAHELGDWLKEARKSLMDGVQIDLNGHLPKGVVKVTVLPEYLLAKQYALLCGFLTKIDTVIALHAGDAQSKNKTHILARTMGGKFSSIEEVEGKTLLTFLKSYQAAKTPSKALLLALDFAKKCFTGVDGILVAGTKRGEVAKEIKTTKFPEILKAANLFLMDQSSKNLHGLFTLIKSNAKTSLFRRDLFNRFFHILKIHIDGEASTILESASVYQREFRHAGRPIRHTKLIGTTLLVKGLEYDHAVILDGDSLNSKELYVAMTRGSKSLTIITTNQAGKLPA